MSVKYILLFFCIAAIRLASEARLQQPLAPCPADDCCFLLLVDGVPLETIRCECYGIDLNTYRFFIEMSQG